MPRIAAACSRQPLQQVIGHTDRIGDRGEGRVHRSDADEEARVHDIQIVELMSLAVDIQYRGLRIGSEPARPGLVGTAGDRNVCLHIDACEG